MTWSYLGASGLYNILGQDSFLKSTLVSLILFSKKLMTKNVPKFWFCTEAIWGFKSRAGVECSNLEDLILYIQIYHDLSIFRLFMTFLMFSRWILFFLECVFFGFCDFPMIPSSFFYPASGFNSSTFSFNGSNQGFLGTVSFFVSGFGGLILD